MQDSNLATWAITLSEIDCMIEHVLAKDSGNIILSIYAAESYLRL